MSSSPMDVLAVERAKSQPVRLPGGATAFAALASGQRLPPFLTGEIRSLLKTYTWRTGFGHDQLHPRHLSLCSDRFFPAVVLLRRRKERSVGLSMDLAKVTGGFRTVCLLTSAHRVWAKSRMPIVRAWAASVPGGYLAAGVEKSTEMAVGKLKVAAERGRARAGSGVRSWTSTNATITLVTAVSKNRQRLWDSHRRSFVGVSQC